MTGFQSKRDMAQEKTSMTKDEVIAGVLFDFMGWLTSRKERIVLSASDDAAPAVDAIRDFATKRGLSLDDAQVQTWREALAQPAQEPVAACPCRSCDGTGERYTGIDEAPTSICKPCAGTGQTALAQPVQESVAYQDTADKCRLETVPASGALLPQRPWVGLTVDELIDIEQKYVGHESLTRSIEAKLKQKNT